VRAPDSLRGCVKENCPAAGRRHGSGRLRQGSWGRIGFSNAIFCAASGSRAAAGAGGAAVRAAGGSARGSAEALLQRS
jgi:hypothetical protein